MSFFQELNTNIKIVEDLLLADADLCLLLYSNNINPLAQTPIVDTKVLRMVNLFPLPKMPDVQTEQKSFLNYYFDTIEPWDNFKFRRTYLCFDIICHLDLWLISEAVRPYSILSKIDAIFNYASTETAAINSLSDTNPLFNSCNMTKYSDKFYGYHITYNVTNTSNFRCL